MNSIELEINGLKYLVEYDTRKDGYTGIYAKDIYIVNPDGRETNINDLLLFLEAETLEKNGLFNIFEDLVWKELRK